jgi:hypothetical protein
MLPIAHRKNNPSVYGANKIKDGGARAKRSKPKNASLRSKSIFNNWWKIKYAPIPATELTINKLNNGEILIFIKNDARKGNNGWKAVVPSEEL